MKKSTKIIFSIMMLFAVVLLLPHGRSAAAAPSGSWGSLSWAIDDGVLRISGTGSMDDFEENSSSAWLAYQGNIEKVILEPGVTGIGSCAFYGCGNLTEISIPASVTFIGDYTFYGCQSMKDIELPAGIKYVGDYLFYRCRNLAFVTLPGSVTSIGDYAFCDCSGLAHIDIPAKVSFIGAYAFSGCVGLEEIAIPSAVSYIGEYGFYGCKGLKSLAISNWLSDIGPYTFADCTGLESVTFPMYADSISDHAFSGCAALKSVSIMAQLKSIGTDAFSGCGSLQDVCYYGKQTQWEQLNIRPGNDALKSADIRFVEYKDSGMYGNLLWTLDNDGLLTISGTGPMAEHEGSEGFYGWFSYTNYGLVTKIVICPGITSICSDAFSTYWDSYLTSVTIPSTVESIGEKAFYGCSSLRDITIPPSVKSIGAEAFYCTGLRSVTIPSGVTDIGDAAFNFCTDLENVSISDTVESIGEKAFAYCSDLTGIHVDAANAYFRDDDGVLLSRDNARLLAFPGRKSGTYTVPDGVVQIDSWAFYKCDWLEGVTLPSSVERIGDQAFCECHRLANVDLAPGLISIGSSAFENTGLLDLILPDSVTEIGERAFGCPYLRNAKLSAGLESIGDKVFWYCRSLENISIPAGVRQIGSNTFYYCKSLAKVILPESVTAIDARAFDDCDELTDVFYAGEQSQWDAIVFGEGNTPLTRAEIHYNAKSYTVTYSANGGEGAPDPASEQVGTVLSLSSVVPARARTGSGYYTVTLDANGGSVTPASMKAARFTDYSFQGWNTMADGSGTAYAPGARYSADEDVTLYAQWKESAVAETLTLPVPTRTGYTFQGWADKPDAQFGISDSYTPGADVTLYAVWRAELAFDVSRDAYPFNNSMRAYGYSGRGPGASYPIKYASFSLIFGDTVAGKSKYRQAMMTQWGGNCCGMSSSSALMFAGVKSAGEFGRSNVHSLRTDDYDDSMSVLGFVEAMQVAQYTDQFARDYQNNRVYSRELADGSRKLNTLYSAVGGDLAQGRCTIIGVCRAGIGAHALLAYRLEKLSDAESRMYVYDCNFPDETRFFTLRFDSAGRAVGWSYDMGGYGVWGGVQDDFISYIPYSTIEYIWTHRGRLYDKNEMLSFSSENLSILDYGGREVAAIIGGQLHTNRADIYALPELSMSWNGTKSVFLPKDFYTITSNDGAALDVSMVDGNTGASVTTSATMVSFAVDDNTRENTVIVENATQEDTYSVSLESSLSGVKYENIVVSGTGRGESISISGDNDTLSISNCNVSALEINGVEHTTSTVTAYAGAGGSISPGGEVLIDLNGGKRFTIVPDTGYVIESVLVDGENVGAVSEYDFENVIRDHSITATFRKAYAVTAAVLDRDSNTVNAEIINLNRVKLVCCAFDSEGRMLCMASRNVARDSGTASISLPCALPGNVTLKLLILDTRWRPLCEIYRFTA